MSEIYRYLWYLKCFKLSCLLSLYFELISQFEAFLNFKLASFSLWLGLQALFFLLFFSFLFCSIFSLFFKFVLVLKHSTSLLVFSASLGFLSLFLSFFLFVLSLFTFSIFILLEFSLRLLFFFC